MGGDTSAMEGRAETPSARVMDVVRFARFVLSRAGGRWRLALALLIGASLAEGGAILVLIPLLNASLGQGAQVGGLVDRLQLPLEISLGVLVVLVILQAWLTRAKNLAIQAIFTSFVANLRLDVFNALMDAQWRYLGAQRTADLTHLMVVDVDRAGASAINVLSLMQSLILLLAYVAVSMIISPAITAFAALMGILSLALLAPVRREAVRQGLALTDNQRAQHRTISDFLSGLKTARSLNAEGAFRAALAATLSQMSAEVMNFARLSATRAAMVQVLSIVALAGFLYLSIRHFLLPLPQIVAMALVFMRISPRFLGLQGHIQEILRGIPLLARIRSLIQDASSASATAPLAKRRFDGFQSEIAFENVSVFYSDRALAAVQGLSFRLKAGEAIAVIGPSGSGKSTVADLLLGVINADEGAISVDGLDLRGIDQDQWRSQIGYVGQDVFLFNETVAANLRLGAPNASDADLWAALSSAHVDDVVRALPHQLATPIGDRGGALSGGERQRLALARALLRKPRLLILDEATSALDWESQEAIARAVSALRGACTILVIAHRPNMVAIADTVMSLEAGRLVEMGALSALAMEPTSRVAALFASEKNIQRRA